MKYADMYKEAKVSYDQALTEYYNVINTKEYIESVYSAPFEFLRALYLAKRIDLFNSAPLGKKPHFIVTSMQEAVSTYKDIMLYKNNISDLLNKASVINQATNAADKVNNLVELSSYLEDNLLISYNEKIADLAKECIKELPKSAKFVTSDLREHFLLDVLVSLNEEKVINVLAAKGMFKKVDLNPLYKLAVSDEEKAGLALLYKAFNYEATPILSTDLRLKGVTFEGKFGDNRQNNLKALKEYIDNTNEKPSLEFEKFTFTPEIGAPEPAVRVLWGNKDLGFLPKDVAGQIHDEYEGKNIRLSVKEVVGGDTVSYGLEVNLEIIEPVVVEERDEDLEK